MKFSVIIPVFNSAKTVARAIASIPIVSGMEVIVVDDTSTDDTFYEVQDAFRLRQNGATKLMRRARNGGPGVARNDGINAALGDWLVFLDADDEMLPSALDRIGAAATDDVDVVYYGPKPIPADKHELLRAYLRLQTDGAVIYAAMRRSMLVDNSMQFAVGLHEDVDFLFYAYLNARRIATVGVPCYAKHDHPGQITSTITPEHLAGIFRAWRKVGLLGNPISHKDYEKGCIALVATRLREIAMKVPAYEDQRKLYETLRRLTFQNPVIAKACLNCCGDTKYARLVQSFVLSGNVLTTNGARKITERLGKIIASSWSCNDLHGSLFLGPDEVRACCKRFFVGGEQRGDVVLLGEGDEISLGAVAGAKRSLLSAMNAGLPTQCDGCPHKEFKHWPQQPALTLLSMEHHSVCNMRCSYCSDTYYGGKAPAYEVEALVGELVAAKKIGSGTTVVWGGGEPTVGKDFERMALQFAHCDAQQRVLTNALSPHGEDVVKELLLTDAGTVVTSVDAGTEETFERVRGVKGLSKVLDRLSEYASIDAGRVTVKYILTKGNCEPDELDAFAALAKQHGLSKCSFQLSCDFTQDIATSAQVAAVAALYKSLLGIGAQVVFCDDLLRQRLCGPGYWAKGQGIADPLNTPHVILYGGGQIARLLIEQSSFFKKADVAFIADSAADKGPQQRYGKPLMSQHVVFGSALPIVIAASQGYAAIHNKLMRGGCDPKRIVRELIL